METPASAPPWQPITFGGVASFSLASFGRLFLVQLLVALLVAASVNCLLISAWFPTLQKAIARLPEKGMIRGGRLVWSSPSPTWLAEGKFLSILVDTEGSRRTGQSADVQLEFGGNELKIESLLGYLAIPYPKRWTIAFNRPETEPRWQAWRPFLVAGVAAGVVIGLMAGWLLLATLYLLPLRLIAFYSDRQVNWPGCWRIAGAAQLPGALLLSGAVPLYSFNRLNLVGLLFAWLLHVVVAWIYLGIAPSRLPRLPIRPRRRENPFGEGQS